MIEARYRHSAFVTSNSKQTLRDVIVYKVLKLYGPQSKSMISITFQVFFR